MKVSNSRANIATVPVLLALAVFGALFVPAAKGAMPTSIGVQAERIGQGASAEAAYRLNIDAGSSGAAFGLSYQLPPWPASEKLLGSPLAIAMVGFNGSGSMRPVAVPAVPKPSLKYQEICKREGPSPFASAFWIELPSGGKVQLELRGRASYSRWPGTRYDIEFSTFDADTPFATLTPLQAVSTSPLGMRGTHIVMRSLKAQGQNGLPRTTPEIVGRTDPPLRLSPISLRAVRPTRGGGVSLGQWSKPKPAAVPLGTVRTDGQGRFRLAPQRFPYVGRYAFLARSRAQRAVAADWNCGPFF